MSVSISVPTVLRRFTADQASVTLEAATVHDALTALTSAYPALQKHLFDSDGKLRSFVNVYVGSQDVRNLPDKHNSTLEDGAQLTIVPSIAGGSGLPQNQSADLGGLRAASGLTPKNTANTQDICCFPKSAWKANSNSRMPPSWSSEQAA
ncbi:MAG: MoaD/ThiS family protein [bacterium]|nr:MoaD/ThiS family protein [bacterium]